MTKQEAARINMIKSQIRTNRILDERVVAAIELVAREQFAPAKFSGVSYADSEIVLAEGRVILEPLIFATMLQEAGLNPDNKVLVVAGGAGYSAAVLASLVKEVTLLESNEELVSKAEKKLKDLKIENVKIQKAELSSSGKSKYFDAAIIEGSVQQLPENILSQLKDGGKLLTVLQEKDGGVSSLVVAVRNGKSTTQKQIGFASATLIPEFKKKKSFSF